MRILKPGQSVAFSSSFLRSVQGHHMASHRGQVLETYSAGKVLVCRVSWQDGTTSSALASNLVAVDRMHLETV